MNRTGFSFISRGLAIFTVFGAALAAPPRAVAADAAAALLGIADTHIDSSLIAETTSITPGQPLQLALRQKIQEGWHTYWINPGDSGLPAEIEWRLPQGFSAQPIVWPAPERIPYGPLISYGYHGDLLLPVTVDVPANLEPGKDVTLSAHATYLVCADVCVPEEAELELVLPVKAGPAAPDPRWAAAFAATRAAIPAENPFPAKASYDDKNIRLTLAMGDTTQLSDVVFFPFDNKAVDNDAAQSATTGKDGLTVAVARDAKKAVPAELAGVLTFRDRSTGDPGIVRAIAISAPATAGAASTASAAPMGKVGLMEALLLALVGGMILNLMPCVLPVLSIKALGLVKHAQEAPREVRLQGFAYTLGVLVSFGLVAGALIALRAAGAEIGWGFQLQSPIFVGAMIYILFAVGLSLSGIFSFGDSLTGIGSGLAARQGYSGSFFTGALATLVATPCTAPFMAAALGFAITQPWYVSVAVFEAVGLGLALPYLLLAFSPAMRRFLPKPGAWMHTFKQVLAFPVYATVVWLAFVLSSQAGSLGITAALAGLVLIAFAAWLYEAVRLGEGARRWVGLAGSVLAVAGAIVLITMIPDTASSGAGTRQASAEENGIKWEKFSLARLDALRAEGKPVFVDFTADWCITCKVNERVALNTEAVGKAFTETGVVALRGDWTKRDGEITRILEENGRAGVPLYLFYAKSAGGEKAKPAVLPQVLTTDTVLRQIRGG